MMCLSCLHAAWRRGNLRILIIETVTMAIMKKMVVMKIMMSKMIMMTIMMRTMGLRIRGGGLAPGGEDNGCHKKSHHCHTPGGHMGGIL